MTTKPSVPAKLYATVLADGTSEEFKTKRQAIARGEYSGQDFTVLSPRGFEVHVHTVPTPEPTPVDEAAKPETTTIPASDLKVGMTVVGGRVRNPIREVGRVVHGRKFVTCWDTNGKDFVYVPVGSTVEIVN